MEIRRWGLDKGLASPAALTTNIAASFQQVLDTEPDASNCKNKQEFLDNWRQLGPIKLSQVAVNCQVPIDLDDDEH